MTFSNSFITVGHATFSLVRAAGRHRNGMFSDCDLTAAPKQRANSGLHGLKLAGS
jgi:hypothetical protein